MNKVEINFYNLILIQILEHEQIVDEAEDTLTILDKYVDGLEITSNKDKVKTLLRNLYDEALSIT